MTSHISGQKVFINELDDSVDALMIEFSELAFAGADIDIFINSEGGDATRALSLVELIGLAKERGSTVSTLVLSQAHSAGSLVAVAGTKGERYVAQRGLYMLHYGQAEGTANSPKAMERMFWSNMYHFDTIVRHYQENCNIEDLEEKLREDNFYVSSEAALGWGMADGTIN